MDLSELLKVEILNTSPGEYFRPMPPLLSEMQRRVGEHCDACIRIRAECVYLDYAQTKYNRELSHVAAARDLEQLRRHHH